MHGHDDISRLLAVQADLAMLRRWQSRAATWLTVGLPAPEHARHLLEAFALYLDRCDGAAHLIVIQARNQTTSAMATLRETAATMSLTKYIDLMSDADDACRKAAFLCADALVVVGDGGVALIEAMALGTPVIGLLHSLQTQDLVIDAGLLWDEAEAGLLAGSMERLREDSSLRALLRERGFERFASMVGTAPTRGCDAVRHERCA